MKTMIETILAKEAIPEKRRYFSFKMAHGYGLATQDFNKIHEKIVYGFMLKGMLQAYASRSLGRIIPGMQCAEQRSRYEQVIPLNSGAVCFALDDIKREGDAVHIKVGMRLRSQAKTAAYSELTFVTELPAFSGQASTPDEDAPLGHEITEEDAKRVA
ncbi:MAG TPA: hypothetical protein VI612_02700, partial [Candidatus Nanoarchaeia archaeon]|nr:hypothetical protein [Candidatus Nanoarchaeia archaeon]